MGTTAGPASIDRADRADRVGAKTGTPLERFLLGLRAKDASEHTLRSYETAVGTYLDWLAERGVDWRSPARADLRAYLARLVGSGAKSSVSQRLAAIRSFHRFAARAGAVDEGDHLVIAPPWHARQRLVDGEGDKSDVAGAVVISHRVGVARRGGVFEVGRRSAIHVAGFGGVLEMDVNVERNETRGIDGAVQVVETSEMMMRGEGDAA